MAIDDAEDDNGEASKLSAKVELLAGQASKQMWLSILFLPLMLRMSNSF